MATTVVLYDRPDDPEKFDEYYFRVHVPLAGRIPGLTRFVVSDGPVSTTGSTPYHLVAELAFDSAEAMRAGMSSPEGIAATEDVANFAQGVTILTFDERVIQRPTDQSRTE
ncbi:EthD family reductase [Amycolatopsis acidiphila]|uniref:EthD family reductase n=1 Tax=Amycolatopsis acidiphila TaxID=715473 RepID=A0A558AJ48_9PSEU|nr:EthD family reductase [Amycolatopsis acidiphila]TVT24292.1 EthD family reductase [Amycolatopsis acidiphila]UIJ62575.1 EthD family reductase [Amycolatopsis acidiphila]GHG85515.1 putative ethyl tert-butyl ether degradation protein EthD [Amycolatopsis acidiphila]